MAFNTKNSRKLKPSPGPMATSPTPTGTLGGGSQPGYAYEDKSALFMLAVNSFFGQKKFYETAKAGDDRFVALVRKVTKADPVWMLDFLTWLRASGNMRSSAVVGSVEAAIVAKGFTETNEVKARALAQQAGWGRKLAKAGIGRADEIGEAIAYFFSKYPGQQIPKPLKRAWADAMVKHFNEYTAAKYGSANSGKEFTPDRLINLLHPKPSAPWQADLFGYLVARKYGEVEIPESLVKLATRKQLMDLPVSERRALLSHAYVTQMFKAAGMTWEALAGWLQGPMDAKAWEAIIPNMGYMALLRNLRNFDEAGVSQGVANHVAAQLMDPVQVKRSKQFPFRFLAAYRAAPNLRWASALSAALNASLTNIPVLTGRTLIMVDTSGSMNHTFSEHSEMKRWDAAALFGIALGLRSPGVDVVSFSNDGKVFGVRKGADVLSELTRWGKEGYNLNGGTNTFGVLQRAYRGHDRVIILTDEQVNMGSVGRFSYPYGGHSSLGQIVPADKHVFTYNLAGYAQGHAPTGAFRHSFGGLTDACFPMIDMIERAQAGRWPWQQAD